MNESLWRANAGILVTALFCMRCYWQIRARTWEKGRMHLGPVIFVQILLTIPALFGLVFFLVYPPLIRWASIPLADAVRWGGVFLIMASGVLLSWTQVCLGSNFSPMLRIRDEQRLVTDGIYRFMRHPMYTAICLLSIGMFLVTANWLVGVSWILCTALVMIMRTPIEERILLETFGPDYQRYMRRVPRYFPRIGPVLGCGQPRD